MNSSPLDLCYDVFQSVHSMMKMKIGKIKHTMKTHKFLDFMFLDFCFAFSFFPVLVLMCVYHDFNNLM